MFVITDFWAVELKIVIFFWVYSPNQNALQLLTNELGSGAGRLGCIVPTFKSHDKCAPSKNWIVLCQWVPSVVL